MNKHISKDPQNKKQKSEIIRMQTTTLYVPGVSSLSYHAVSCYHPTFQWDLVLVFPTSGSLTCPVLL